MEQYQHNYCIWSYSLTKRPFYYTLTSCRFEEFAEYRNYSWKSRTGGKSQMAKTKGIKGKIVQRDVTLEPIEGSSFPDILSRVVVEVDIGIKDSILCLSSDKRGLTASYRCNSRGVQKPSLGETEV